MYYVLCIMYYVLCIMYYVLCIMYYVLGTLAISRAQDKFEPEEPPTKSPSS
jgi:hypothetical protein